MPISAGHGNGGKLVRLHDAEADAGVFLDFLLQVLGKLFVVFRGHHSQGVDLEAAYPLTILIDAQAQATANGLAALALGLNVTQGANLEHVGVVPAFLERRVGEDELQRRAEGQQLFLLLHDQVVGALGILPVARIVLRGVGPTAFLVDGEVAVVHVLGGKRQVDLGEQALIGRQLGGATILFLEYLRIHALDRLAVRIVLTVLVHRVDEEQAEHLDPQRAQVLLLVQVFLDRAADHLALHGQRIHITVGLARLQEHFAAGVAQFHELFALGRIDITHPKIGIDRAAIGALLEVVAIADRHLNPLHASGGLFIQLDLGADAAALVFHLHQAHERLVVRVLYRGRRHFDLLDQLALVGIHRIQAVHHVVLVHVGGGIAQCAQRVHRIQRFLATAFQAAVHALRFIHDDDRPGGLDQVNGLLATGLLALLVEVVHILLVDGAHRHHHDLDVGTGGEVAHRPGLTRVVQEVIERHARVESLEVLLGDLQGFVNAFLDRH